MGQGLLERRWLRGVKDGMTKLECKSYRGTIANSIVADRRQCKVLDLLLLRDSGCSTHSYMSSGWVPREGTNAELLPTALL